MSKTIKQMYKIGATPDKVWDALINPAKIKQYFFGTEVFSDWKEGSPIIYKAAWEGKTYVNKGNVLKLVPEQLLITNYWSPFWGKPDSPENYVTYSYALLPFAEGSQLTLTIEDNFESEDRKREALQNWDKIIKGLKFLAEE